MGVSILKDIFLLIGLFSTITIFSAFLVMVCRFIKETVSDWRRRIRYKRRFNVPPTAACYCADCVKWNPLTGECYDHCNSRLMADCWFCCFADPMTETQLKLRHKQMEDEECLD